MPTSDCDEAFRLDERRWSRDELSSEDPATPDV